MILELGAREFDIVMHSSLCCVSVRLSGDVNGYGHAGPSCSSED